MELTQAIPQNFVNGASPYGPAAGVRAKNDSLDNGNPEKSSRLTLQSEQTSTDKIDKSSPANTGSTEAPAPPSPADTYAFFLQQKNFAYLPINTPSSVANKASAASNTFEQKDPLPIATFLQVANPRRDVRLIDTYV